MPTKVLITHSYFYRFDPKQWKSKRYYPPLGTLYAASVLRESGAEVIFHDTCLSKSTQDLAPLLAYHNPDLLVIYDDGFNYLTKMCLTNMREAAFRMMHMGNAAGCKVVVSSSDSTDHYEEYLEKGADFVLLGEGEETLKELYHTLTSPEKPEPGSVKGIAYKKSEEIICNEPRPMISDLDSLPFPAWDLANLDVYKDTWLENHGYYSVNIATTRGCPYKCSWCAKPIYGYEYNSRSPERVVDEIEWLKENYQVSHFWICDSFNTSRLRLFSIFLDLKRDG